MMQIQITNIRGYRPHECPYQVGQVLPADSFVRPPVYDAKGQLHKDYRSGEPVVEYYGWIADVKLLDPPPPFDRAAVVAACERLFVGTNFGLSHDNQTPESVSLEADYPRGGDGYEPAPVNLRDAAKIIAKLKELFPHCTVERDHCEETVYVTVKSWLASLS